MNKKFSGFDEVLLDSLHEGLYRVDKNFKITGFNNAAERITGYSRDEVIGRFCKNILKTDRCKQGCPLTYALEIGENVSNYNMIITGKNNSGIQMKINAAIFGEEMGGEAGGFVVFRPLSKISVLNKVGTKRREFEGIIGQNKFM